MIIEDNDIVLFQGDSITDCGRNRQDENHLGTGYAMMTAAWFNALYPEKNIRFLNKGISGNRAIDLKNRWTQDCIDLKPDIVSILIGINDTWRRYDRDDPTSTEDYINYYRYILAEIKEKLGAKVILCEPFLLSVTEAQKKDWREDLDPKINGVRELAREFGAIYVPFDGLFAAASTKQPPVYWAADGVHPTAAGHALMSQAWLRAVKAL
ncbi:MAG: SGNH/GDSL hydrolase family protein [Epulopiscium sp.]|nr:SGNH/GDSL hydrolase family protein [Candidatus Epulonipiscium sp.]